MSELARIDATLVTITTFSNAEGFRDMLAALEEADAERAHSLEDDFAREVLAAIRDGHPNPAELAREALIVLSADYGRWYA